jgi:hypothetical protein
VSVTVLLPVYNGSGTLVETIDSVLAQSHRDFELLVVDDRSTDGSGDLVDAAAARDQRIRLVRHDRNVGLAATLNEGLALARHDLVARIDQDDVALPERLAVQLAFMRAHPQLAVAGSWVYHMGATPRHDRLVRLPIEPPDVRRALASANCVYHPSVMLRRDVILGLGGYRAAFANAEDYDLWLRVARVAEIANVARPLLRYRFSLGGMTLARKWEQMYYVCLAQVNDQVRGDVAPAEALAREVADLIDRGDYMRTVARGTVDELAALRLWREGFDLVRRFRGEIGPRHASSLAARLALRRIGIGFRESPYGGPQGRRPSG